MKITEIDRAAAKEIRQAVDDALLKALEPIGLSHKLGRATIDGETMTAAITFRLGSEAVKALEDAEKEKWHLHCAIWSLNPSDFGRSFKCDGTAWKIVGCNPNRPKFPILCKCLNGRKAGKSYFMPATTVRICLVPAMGGAA